MDISEEEYNTCIDVLHKLVEAEPAWLDCQDCPRYYYCVEDTGCIYENLNIAAELVTAIKEKLEND